MTDIQTIVHKKKKQTYATIILKPDPDKASGVITEKDAQFGLFVLGTEKHESRRIDNQLRGRSGRQGDPGVSQFYVALDDEIMRKMGGDTIKSIAKRLLPADELAKLELTQSQFTNSIIRAQKQMEGYNFSIRKHLFEYDNVVNKQRMKVYGKRDEILSRDANSIDDVFAQIASMIQEVVRDVVVNREKAEQSGEELIETIQQIYGIDISEKEAVSTAAKPAQIISSIASVLIEEFDRKTHIVTDPGTLMSILRSMYLESIDKYWIEHIDTMQRLREKVGLYGYAQQDPLVIYKQESFKLYSQLWLTIKMEFLSMVFKIDFTQFHGLNGGVDFGIVDTNEEDFEDNLTGDMSGVQMSNKTLSDQGIQIIDISQTKKQPLFIDKKVGQNEPCPCGSGKKYKKCHGA